MVEPEVYVRKYAPFPTILPGGKLSVGEEKGGEEKGRGKIKRNSMFKWVKYTQKLLYKKTRKWFLKSKYWCSGESGKYNIKGFGPKITKKHYPVKSAYPATVYIKLGYSSIRNYK